MLDTFTDRNGTFRKQTYNDRNELQRYKSLRYAKDIELIFTITNDHTNYPNRISVPLLRVTYGEVNMTTLNGKSFSVYVDFRMQIKFVKNYEFGSMSDVSEITFMLLPDVVYRVQICFFNFTDSFVRVACDSIYIFPIPGVLLQDETTTTILRCRYFCKIRSASVFERWKRTVRTSNIYQHICIDSGTDTIHC